jgi:multicomponent Na+:H+ antiporter subunit E
MITATQDGRQQNARRRRVGGLQPVPLIWLTVVWVALWGDLSAANVLGGLLVGVAVCLVFPLPALKLQVRVRPLRLLGLILHFLADVVMASAQVSWTTLRLHRQPRNAVIEIDLRTQSDFVLTVVAEMVSLVPGSLVVEARRSTHTLFLHVLDAQDEAGVESMRAEVFRLERRVVRALGAETWHLGQPPEPDAGSATVEPSP